MRKHGLKVLGLAVMAAIGLMAFSATSALAVNLTLGDKFYENNEAAGKFLVKTGTEFPAPLPTQEVKGAQIGSGILEIPKKAAEIVCPTGELTGFVANDYQNYINGLVENGGHGHVTLTFKGCKTNKITEAGALTGEELKNCVPNGTGTITANVLLLVKKHEKVTYLLFVPLVNSKATAEAAEKLTSFFTELTFSELCALPSPTKIFGSLTVKAPTADTVKPVLKVDSLVKPDQELIGAKLNFGASPAFIKAEVEVELPKNPGVAWGAM